MKLRDFLKDKCLLLILHLICICLMTGFLKITDYSETNIILIIIFWMIILTVWLLITYIQRRKYFQEAQQILEKMDQRYLLGELLPSSFLLEDKIYQNMIRKSNKSVIERIRKIEDEQREYKEYIESWVHEIKAPITGISLICDNRRKINEIEFISVKAKEAFQMICLENQKIENYVDMVLYYARSEAVYKDYLIQETRLDEVVFEVLHKNQLLLIKSQVQVKVDCLDVVYTDKKWIAFILNQLILNSVKYKSDSPFFHIYTKRGKNGVILAVEDNGIGIQGEEISRIFEKGFTGSNGRNHEKSTGMGLYLCRKLCDKLGIDIRAESVYGKGSKILLEFPISNYIERV